MAEPDDAPAPAAELDDFTASLAAQGFPIAGGFPVNERLRGEALARAGHAEDPLGYVTPAFIAETGERLAAEAHDAAAADRAARANTPSMSWNRADLAAHAEAKGVAFETDANKAAILAAIEAATNTPSNEG